MANAAPHSFLLTAGRSKSPLVGQRGQRFRADWGRPAWKWAAFTAVIRSMPRGVLPKNQLTRADSDRPVFDPNAE